MSLDLHTVEAVPGAAPNANDKLRVGYLNAIANAAGGSAGASVAVAITGLSLPPNYNVHVEVDQDANAWISSKTQSGFTVNLEPRLAANTLAAGTFNVTIVA